MSKLDVKNGISRTFHKVGFGLKKHSPEILVVGGVIGVVASAVMACKATTKISQIMNEKDDQIEAINDIIENPKKYSKKIQEEYTQEDAKKDISIVKTKTGFKLIKLYAPSVVLGTLSIVSIFAGTGILHKRNVALAAAYTTIDKSFREYRERVVDRFGKELDRELKYNIKAKEVEEVVVDEKGKEKTVKKTVNVMENDPSDYAFFFDNGCNGWQKDAEQNKWHVRQMQNWANDKLKAQGYLFLNDVREMFGLQPTKAGQIVGWKYYKNGVNPNGDNYVDFGIYDITKEANRDFVNGWERSILLEPNVQGPILDLI